MGIRTVRKILLVVAGSVFLFSACMVLRHSVAMRSSAAYTESVIQMAVTQTENVTGEESPADDAAGSAPPEVVEEPVTDGDVMDVAPIQVDFGALFGQNQDVIAWLYCPDTPINYPVAQASDNEYYLHRLLDGSKNSAGTLFMDYRSASDLSDWNCVIYGHNMINDSMFGSLTDYKSQEYFDAHAKMYLLTPEGDFLIIPVAGFTAAANDELYSKFCPDREDRSRLVKDWLERSDFCSDYEPVEEDRFITLSTCSYDYDNARYVLVGVLKKLRTGE